jgi:hypothetical protein
MRRKRLMNVFALLTVFVLLLYGYWRFRGIIGWPIPSKTDFARIEVGMSQNDVTEILGMPNGRLSDPNVLCWVGSDGQIGVWLDSNGKVKNKELHSEPDLWMARLWRRFVPR